MTYFMSQLIQSEFNLSLLLVQLNARGKIYLKNSVSELGKYLAF